MGGGIPNEGNIPVGYAACEVMQYKSYSYGFTPNVTGVLVWYSPTARFFVIIYGDGMYVGVVFKWPLGSAAQCYEINLHGIFNTIALWG